MKEPLHHHIKKHLRKHKRKYLKFILFFTVLVIYGSLDNVVAFYFVKTETPLEMILFALLISAIFTAIGELVETEWEKRKRRLT